MNDACIQCNRAPGHGQVLLTRARPMGPGTYQICLDCAVRVKREQDERAQQAIKQAERSGV